MHRNGCFVQRNELHLRLAFSTYVVLCGYANAFRIASAAVVPLAAMDQIVVCLDHRWCFAECAVLPTPVLKQTIHRATRVEP